jgi:predicted ATP-dependent endonuclease of OLD family
MYLKYLFIEEYKNLKNLEWDIDINNQSQIICIIGENGAGKSNLLEALIHIFNCLNFNDKEKPLFNFEIQYSIDNLIVKVKGKNGNRDSFQVFYNNHEIPFEKIVQFSKLWIYPKYLSEVENLLPENIICYYTGYSQRIKHLFNTVNKESAKVFRQGKSIKLPPLLLLQPFHFKMILLALFSFEKDVNYIYKDFLLTYFGIEGFESVAIHIKKHTNWIKDSQFKNYFDTKGIIRNFISSLNEIQEKENKSLNLQDILCPPFKIPSKSNFLLINKVIYLLRSQSSVIELKNAIGFESDLFKMLNILYQSGYLSDIEIMLKKKGVENPISFDDLSEGEQQLLAIKGCIEILRGKNNLFLWDEPDTFLNPRWQWDLIPDLVKQIGDKVEDQFILTTHSPVLLSTNKKGVFEMKNGSISLIKGTYGITVNDALSKQNIIVQLKEVRDIYNEYVSLIQQGLGLSEEALFYKKQLEERWGVNHPDLIMANLYLKYYEVH